MCIDWRAYILSCSNVHTHMHMCRGTHPAMPIFESQRERQGHGERERKRERETFLGFGFKPLAKQYALSWATVLKNFKVSAASSPCQSMVASALANFSFLAAACAAASGSSCRFRFPTATLPDIEPSTAPCVLSARLQLAPPACSALSRPPEAASP